MTISNEKTYVMGFFLATGNWTLSFTFGTHRPNKFCVFRCLRLHKVIWDKKYPHTKGKHGKYFTHTLKIAYVR